MGHSGNGTLTFANGSLYNGQFENGKMHGEGKLMFANGDVYEGLNNTKKIILMDSTLRNLAF